MDFTLSMFTSSGIVVRYLKIFEKTNYNTVKWVRYLVKAGSYEIRVSIAFSNYVQFFANLPSSIKYKFCDFESFSNWTILECCYKLLAYFPMDGGKIQHHIFLLINL